MANAIGFELLMPGI